VYAREVADRALTFGVSGMLYKDGLVMYDRQTDTLWTQVDGRAVRGKLAGQQLQIVPAIHATWKEWRALYPERHPQGVTRPSGDTVKASPGSVPEPGVGTTSTSRTSFANTLRVAAPVAFSSHALPSLTRMDGRAFVGTSLKLISQRSDPTAVISIRAKPRQLG
jgi:hypothetical protein